MFSFEERYVKVSTSAAAAIKDDPPGVVWSVGGAASSLRNGKDAFKVYVDPEMELDIGEILVVRKFRGGVWMWMFHPFFRLFG